MSSVPATNYSTEKALVRVQYFQLPTVYRLFTAPLKEDRGKTLLNGDSHKLENP